MGVELLYEDNEIKVVGSFLDRSTKLCFTFYGRDANASKSEAPWGESFLREQGYSVIGFIPKRLNWYQELLEGDRVQRILAAIRVSRSPSYSVRATYGTSMGAYAAIRFASLLNANRVVALSPPASIKGVPIWSDDCEGEIDQITATSVVSGSQVLIVYDGVLTADLMPPDAEFARQIAANISTVCNLVELNIEYGGHPTTNLLSEVKLLKPLVGRFLAGQDVSNFVVPEARLKQSSRYVLQKLIVCRKRGDWEDACVSINSNLRLIMENPRLSQVALSLVRKNDPGSRLDLILTAAIGYL